MRRASIGLVALLTIGGSNTLAQDSCSVGGATYSHGASACQPAVQDGQVEQVLFTCNDGAWTSTDTACPDAFAYFCQIGPHAVAIGEQLLLGEGPAVLECRFPGVFQLNQGAAPLAPPETPSTVVRNVQAFLSDEGEGLSCDPNTCTGLADEETLSAIATYLRRNFANLLDEEREAFGFASEADVEVVILTHSPIDIVPLFARIFDVPNAR
ncbi:hypothetical protein [Bauldia sp.]|uniref:hypothetical protein n=1 Tax=Bauldia sp. TaxID=2575872 RepID=UPI003BACF35A